MELDEGHEEDDERLHFENGYHSLNSDVEDIIAKHSLNESNNSLHVSLGDNIRLPVIRPPMFDGNLEDWALFFDKFNALFHNNNSLNDVQCLHYLKTSVLGPTAYIIKNF